MPKKGEKITDPKILERLAKAREKALETRKKNAQARKDEKLLLAIEKQRGRDEVKKKLTNVTKKKEEPIVVIEEEKEEKQEEVLPEKEEKVQEEEKKKPALISRATRGKKKQKKRKRYVYVSESESDSSDDNDIPFYDNAASSRRNKQTNMKTRREQLAEHMYRRTYGFQRHY